MSIHSKFMEKANKKRLLLKRGAPEEIFTYTDLLEAWHEGNLSGLSTGSSQLEMLSKLAKMNKNEILERARRNP